MQTLAQIREMLDERGLRPRKSLGQNFLIDHNLLTKLVNRAEVGPEDIVLEVGPGTGVLTEALLERGATVIAAEMDRGLAELLRDRLGEHPRFTLVEGDALRGKSSLSDGVRQALGGRPFKVVANLPYAAGTPIITTVLADHPECPGLWVTVQREVGDRLAAGPGTKSYGTISVLAQAVARVERVAVLPPACFWPRPEVTSVMLAITRRPDPLTTDPRRLFDACQRVFAHRRKRLGGVLGQGFPWPEGVDPDQRAESLDPERIVALCEAGEIR